MLTGCAFCLSLSVTALPETTVPVTAAAAQLDALGLCYSTALRWLPPTSVTLVGAAALGCVPSPGGGAGYHTPPDVALRLPAACLREKDYLDGRVHAVQALYLARVAAALGKSAEWEARPHDWRSHTRSPALLVPGPPPYSQLRVIVSLAPDAFPRARLAPQRANVRGSAADASPPSPVYNAHILADMRIEQFAMEMRAAAAAIPALPAACALLSTWAARRQILLARDGCAGSFLLRAMACAAHARGKVLMAAMNPFQAFKALLRCFGTGLLSHTTAAAPAAMRAAFPVVLLSPDGSCNYAKHVSAAAAAELTAEAAATAAALDAGGRGAVDGALLASLPPTSRYDLHICVTLDEGEEPSNGDGLAQRAVEASIHKVLTRALGDRALRIRVAPGTPGESLVCHVALHGDPAIAWRLVDPGPPAEDAAACKQFRSFWGPKSELRRFADGAITEAVVWDSVPQAQRHTIPGEAACFALKRHVPRLLSCHVTAGCLNASLPDGASGTALMACMDRLAQRLRGLTALPLRVASVQPLSAAFRGAAVAQPAAHPLCGGARGAGGDSDGGVPAVVDVLHIIVQLEGSGAWPDHAEAAAKTRTAFALAISAELGSAFGVASSASESGDVDILFEGFAFRIHVTTEADARRHAQELQTSDTPHVSVVARHAAALAGLCGTHASLGAATRLAKRWLAAQLLGNHFPDEAVDLLVAAGYVHPVHGPATHAGCAPTSREAGFLAFLHTLGDHPWATAPLPVDCLAAGWTGAQRQAAGQVSGESFRGGLCLPTPMDRTGWLWTTRAPCSDALARAAHLARVCARRLAAGFALGGGPDGGGALITAVMQPSLVGYTAVLHLRRAALPHPARVLFPTQSRADEATTTQLLWPLVSDTAEEGTMAHRLPLLSRLPHSLLRSGNEAAARAALLVGFNPVAHLLAALSTRLGGIALVFGDPSCSSDVIAVAARPGVVAPGMPALRLSRAVCMQPQQDGGGGGVELNVAELAAECAVLGAGLVTAVAVHQGQQAAPLAGGKRRRAASVGGTGKRLREARAVI